MARDPHDTVDFAPAWLNFNNSNKKKAERANNSSSQGSIPSLNPPLKSSQEPVFRTSSLGGGRVGGSPSRSTGNATRWLHQSPTSRSNNRHQSVDFSYGGDEIDGFSRSPIKDQKSTWTRSGTFSPTFSSKRDTGFLSRLNKNGKAWPRHVSGTGDTVLGLDTEFPSLSDIDISDQNKAKQPQATQVSTSSSVVNMWEKPLVLKTTEPDSSQNPNAASMAKSHLTSSIYKTLIPKPAPHPKQPYRRTLSVPLHLPSKSGNSIGELITSGSKREHSAIGRQAQVPNSVKPIKENSSISPRFLRPDHRTSAGKNLEIGVISGHKKHRKGKSHFLKTLRQTESGHDSAGRVHFPEGEAPSNPSSEKFGPHPMDSDETESQHFESNLEKVEPAPKETNCQNQDTSSRVYPIIFENQLSWEKNTMSQLSSSLEAEHRLLREMGWKYSDDQAMEEEPPLTEDEIREFFTQNKSNGLLSTSSSGHREVAFRNAFSGWKFSGVRKRSDDSDKEESLMNGHIPPPAANNRCSLDDIDSISSDEDDI